MLFLDEDTRRRLQINQAISLAKRPAKPTAKGKLRQLGKKRFNALVGSTARVLQVGEPTKFEFEGACRAGLRSSLCLDGWSWPDADAASAEVVARALTKIGAVRPTWQQGQPEYTQAGFAPILRLRCKHCGNPIPPARIEGSTSTVLYCSAHCSNTASKNFKRLSGERVSRAEHLARCAARSRRLCVRCQKPFQSPQATRLFCSRECSIAERTKYPVIEKQCEQCGRSFTPSRSVRTSGQGGKFCSRGCYHEARAQRAAALGLRCEEM